MILFQVSNEDNEDLVILINDLGKDQTRNVWFYFMSLDYIEYAITGDTARRKRQVSGDYPVYIDEFNDNLVGGVTLNLNKLIGSSTIDSYYYYNVGFILI